MDGKVREEEFKGEPKYSGSFGHAKFEITVKNLKIHVPVEEEFESRNINCMSFK